MKITSNKDRRQKWEGLVEDQKKSGLSQNEFCKLHDLSLSTFGYYRKSKKIKTAPEKPVREFMPVNLTKPISESEVRVILPNGFQFVFRSDTESPRIKELIGIFLSC